MALRVWMQLDLPGLAAATAVRSPRRSVAGGMGRGDLFYRTVDAVRHRSRSLGIQRGLVHNSQATEPQSGQLYYRKRIAHASRRGSSAALRAPIASWAHLMPSLRTGVEAAIPAALHTKLLSQLPQSQLESQYAVNTETGLLTAAEASRLREGQRLFRYELHQRLPLLEDSIAEAALAELIEWPLLLRRAWVVLSEEERESQRSNTAALTSGNAVSTSASCSNSVSPTPLTALAIRSSIDMVPFNTHSNLARSARDVSRTSNQITDLDRRVAVLSTHVRRLVEEELADHRCGSGVTVEAGERAGTHARERVLRAKWVEGCDWLGW